MHITSLNLFTQRYILKPQGEGYGSELWIYVPL